MPGETQAAPALGTIDGQGAARVSAERQYTTSDPRGCPVGHSTQGPGGCGVVQLHGPHPQDVVLFAKHASDVSLQVVRPASRAAQLGAVDAQYVGGALSCQPLAVQEPEVRHSKSGASPHVHLPTVGEHAPPAIGTSGGQATLVVPLAPALPLVPPPTAPLPLVPPPPLSAFAPAPPVPVRPPRPSAAPPFATAPACPPVAMAPPLLRFPSPPIPEPSVREAPHALSVSRLSGRSARDHCRSDTNCSGTAHRAAGRRAPSSFPGRATTCRSSFVLVPSGASNCGPDTRRKRICRAKQAACQRATVTIFSACGCLADACGTI